MSKRSKNDLTRKPKKVFLVDRHALMRRAAAGWVNRCSGLEVCGMAGGMAQALRAVKRLRPDVVVCEIMRPHDFGFIRELHRRHPRLPILVFSTLDKAVYAARARAAGARGYLMKDGGGEKLVRGVCGVLRRRSARTEADKPRSRLFPEQTQQRAENDQAAGRLCGAVLAS